ncbi:YdcF family protein [Candidatus Hepatobacter penaei]|uniref:YdcF family protein n=1 Tax=Candidatus Hepatobacter penaei TaxID=1274402 RepID=UPI00069872C9|nr:YdcF family protein [Candidatus Hepatobacter penaei]
MVVFAGTRKRFFWLGLVGGVLWLWLYGLGLFYAYIHFCGCHQHIRYQDGVVFTGSPGRIQSGLSLLRKKKLRTLFISGVRPTSKHRLFDKTKGLTVSFGFDAGNTRGNIEETRMWAKRHNLSHVTLITADYHMPRCLLLFRRYANHIGTHSYCLKTPLHERIVHGFQEYQKFLWSCVWGHLPKTNPASYAKRPKIS